MCMKAVMYPLLPELVCCPDLKSWSGQLGIPVQLRVLSDTAKSQPKDSTLAVGCDHTATAIAASKQGSLCPGQSGADATTATLGQQLLAHLSKEGDREEGMNGPY